MSSDARVLLDYITCDSYDKWITVGMAVKAEGGSFDDWHEWSRSQPGYKSERDCRLHWDSFTGTGITGGTLVALARQGGYISPGSKFYALDWDSEIEDDGDGYGRPAAPAEWKPEEDLISYLQILFQPDDIIGYVTNDVHQVDDRMSPGRGTYTRTAGSIIKAVKKYGIGPESIGSYDPKVGGWIRFNPLDGDGVKNENVTEYRYALVECDTLPIERQHELIIQLQLPVACLVSSGGKSVHAITHIDADSLDEYKKRVEFLYSFCKEHGLPVDKANKNPSRLSRMPGLMRNGNRQQLLRTNIGRKSWADWMDYIEGNPCEDELPDIEDYAEYVDNPPKMAPDLIAGILRQGHKAIIQGPSKAGKSYLMMQLAAAIADGKPWLGHDCTCGKVLYINLEIDPNSFINRFDKIFKAWNCKPKNPHNLKIWNLRGRAVPIAELAPKIVRRIKGQGYIAVILDPLYKVSMGDENSAGDVGAFCNELDWIASECGCAVIYCHHHAKGSAGGKKTTDRSSGSGVFGRDADAIIDLTPLYIPPDRMPWYQEQNAQAYKVSFEFREYPHLSALNVWFQYPLHVIDSSGNLDEFFEEGSQQANLQKNRNYSTAETRRSALDGAYDLWEQHNPKMLPKIAELAQIAGKAVNTIKNWLSENQDDYEVVNGYVSRFDKNRQSN